MKHSFRFVWLIASISAIALFPAKACAQRGAGAAESHFAVRIADLTAQDRDALQQQVSGRTDLRLVYTCVPAGIMVFAGPQGTSKTMARQRALPVLQSRITGGRITELEQGIAEAEAACAQFRN